MARRKLNSIHSSLQRTRICVLGIAVVLAWGLGYYSLHAVVKLQAEMGLRKVVSARATAVEINPDKSPEEQLQIWLPENQNDIFEFFLGPKGETITSPEVDTQWIEEIKESVISSTEFPYVHDDHVRNYFYGVSPVPGTDWRLVRVFPGAALSTQVLSVLIPPILLILAFGALASYIMQGRVQRLIFQPLEKIDAAIEETTKGGVPNISVTEDNEIGRLARSFENMARALKQREQSLVQTENDLQGTFDAVLEFVTIVDTNFKLVRANRSFVEIYGQPLEKLLGQSRIELFSKESQPMFQKVYETVQETKELQHVSTFSHRNQAHYEMTFLPLLREDDSLYGIVEVTRDVTQRKRLEEQLQQSQKMEALGQLAGGIAHDFNNLLQVILGYAETMQAEARKGHGNLESADKIVDAGHRASELTQQLLAFGRRQIMNTRPVEVDKIIRDSLSLVERLIEANVKINYQPAEQSLVVEADANQIVQVLINLYVNARDAMPGGGEIDITVQRGNAAVSQDNLDQYVQIRVRDCGTGIEPQLLGNIFDPFFTSKEKDKGTGLGLATAYGIVQQHKGDITVESQPGGGTTFTIHLPVYGGDSDTVQPAPQEARPAGGTESILVADDDEGIRDLLAGVLRKAGYKVQLAVDGDDAWRQWEQNGSSYDALVLDVMMPGMSGVSVLQKVRASQPTIPCVLASGYSEEAQHEAIVTDDITGYLAKPFRGDALLKELRRLLTGRRQGPE